MIQNKKKRSTILNSFHAAKWWLRSFFWVRKQTNHRPKYHISSHENHRNENKSETKKKKHKNRVNIMMHGFSHERHKCCGRKNASLPRYMQIFVYGFQAKRLYRADCLCDSMFIMSLWNIHDKTDFHILYVVFTLKIFSKDWPLLNFSTFLHAPVSYLSLKKKKPFSPIQIKKTMISLCIVTQCQPISFFIFKCSLLFPMWWYSNVTVDDLLLLLLLLLPHSVVRTCKTSCSSRPCMCVLFLFVLKRIEFSKHEFLLIPFMPCVRCYYTLFFVAVFAIDNRRK